jgi:hypothetical protein
VAATLAALEKEADGEAAKYGNDIVFMAEFSNAKGQFMAWITVSRAKFVRQIRGEKMPSFFVG